MDSRIGLFSARDLASASGPHAYQSTGLFACCLRYGLVSFASRLGIVRTVAGRQFVGRSAVDQVRSKHTASALPRSQEHGLPRPVAAPWYRRLPWTPIGITIALLVTA